MVILGMVGANTPLIAFITVLAGSLGLPIPTLAVLVFAGSLLAKSGSIPYQAETAIACVTGAAIGDMVWFSLGRTYGPRALGLICRLSLSRDSCVRKTADFFARRGLTTLLFSRFIPGLSIVTAPMAGATGCNFGRFVPYALAGDALWVGTGLMTGLFFSKPFERALQALEHHSVDLLGIVIMLVASYVAVCWIRRQQMLRYLRVPRVTAGQATSLVEVGPAPVFVDVRSRWERDRDPTLIPGSLVVDTADLARGLSMIGLEEVLIPYCSCPNEVSAAIATRRLQAFGYKDVRPLLGGVDAWREAGGPLKSIEGALTVPGKPHGQTDPRIAGDSIITPCLVSDELKQPGCDWEPKGS